MTFASHLGRGFANAGIEGPPANITREASAPAPRLLSKLALLQHFNLRSHVRIAAEAVGRVAAFQDPDFMVRLGPPLVLHGPQRAVAGKALNADLSRDIILGYLTGGMGDRAKGRRRERGGAKEQESRQASTHHHCPQNR